MNIKLFFKIFILLFLFEFIIGICDSYFYMNNTEVFEVRLDSITHIIISVMSKPIGFISKDLPFYAGTFSSSLFFTFLNILIQTFITYFVMSNKKKE